MGQDYVSVVKTKTSIPPWALWMCEDTIPGSGFFGLSDSSGNGRSTDGTAAIANYSNAASLLSGRSQCISRAAGGAIPQTAVNMVPVTGASAWTIDLWISTPSIQSGFHSLSGFGDGAAGTNNCGTALLAGKPGNGVFAGVAISINTVYYLCMDWDGANGHVYQAQFGGSISQVASGAITPFTIPSTGRTQAWQLPSGVGGQDFVGKMQGLAFYAGVMSAADRQAHFNAGQGIFASSRKVFAAGSVPLVARNAGKVNLVG